MSKYVNIFFKLIIFTAVLSGGSSCKKSFLNENLTTAFSKTDFYKTDNGILQLKATGTYYQVLWTFHRTANGNIALPIMGLICEFHIGGESFPIHHGTIMIRSL